jgi:capsular polysaccharide biosynthesis protein
MTLSHTLARKSRTIGFFGLIGLLVSLVVVFAQPLRYGATARLLVIQRSTLGLDPYTAVKSAERIADNLSLVMYTQDFFNKILKQDASIDQTKFPSEPRKRYKAWQKTIRTSLVTGSGLLSVTALSTDQAEAVKLAQAVAGVLTVSGKEYVGGDLEVKLVDSPLASTYPIAPNIPLSLVLGLWIGLLCGLGYAMVGVRE